MLPDEDIKKLIEAQTEVLYSKEDMKLKSYVNPAEYLERSPFLK